MYYKSKVNQRGIKMDGKTHAVVGGVVGGVVSLAVGNDVVGLDTGLLIAVGSFAGLVPDLDTNGKLSNKVTVPHKLVRMFMVAIGLTLLVYTITMVEGIYSLYGAVLAVMLIMFARKVTQRRMLTVTGIIAVIFGLVVGTLWIVLLGVYVVVASYLGHRTYTHSIWGLMYFGYIAYLISLDFSNVNGLFIAMVLGYVSHLVLDFKIFNKQGVKLLRPFVNIEI